MLARAVACVVAGVAAGLCGVVRAQVIPFLTIEVDAGGSGDCKALGDLDLDGKADPIIGGASLSWYESGAGFAKHVIRANTVYKEFTTDAQATDVDGDGDVDIVIGDGAGAGNVLWFENPRIGALGAGDPRIGGNWVLHVIGTHGNTVHDIEAADLDNDGTIEIVTSGHGLTHVWKRAGLVWTERDLSSMAGDGVFLGDIDRDGRRDIATPRAWLKNPGDILGGAWARFPISGAAGDECLLADVNKDGRLDLVTCDAHARAGVYWFEQPPDPTVSTWTRRTIDNAMGAHHPEPMDANADGRPDLLMGLELAEVAVYINLGGSPPTFQKQDVALTGGHNARRGDINGDGLPDILACDYIGNPPVRVHINRWCYANCDGSQEVPVLTVNDFLCFVNSFAAGAVYANCDGSTTGLNIMDFLCYLSRFVAGCPPP